MNRQQLNFSKAHLQELEATVTSVVTLFYTEYLICFSCLNDTKTAVNCFPAGVQLSKTHYFLLMLTGETVHSEHEVQECVNNLTKGITITIIVHGLQSVSSVIAQGSRFFTAACREGALLYSENGSWLNLDYPNLNPATTYFKAQKHYYQRFGMACGFLSSATVSLQNGFLNNCLFELHQGVEQACIAVIRVGMGYRPNMHNIIRLLDLCKCFTGVDNELYPVKDEEDLRLLRLLNKSYADTRYKNDLQISEEDARQLCSRVTTFLELVKTYCNKKLAEYRLEAVEAGKEIKDIVPALPAMLFV